MTQENKKYNILVISNETHIINKLSILFDESKYTFELVRDPLSGIEKVKFKNYDLIIINFTFSKKILELFIKKVRIFDAFAYLVLLSDSNNLPDTLDLMINYDIQSYYNKDEDLKKLSVLVELISNSIYEFKRLNLRADIYSNDYKSPYLNTINALRNIVEYKDIYTVGHSFRVSKYSVLIGKKLGLSGTNLKTLRIGSLFHDIGKIGIPNNILLKDSSLTDLEYFQIKNHTLIGSHILFPVNMYAKIIPIVKFHHERFDGYGYPTKLKGTDIPLLARIVTVADTFDAMTSCRTYRDALPLEHVISEFENNKGTQFDPEITDVFLDILKNDYSKIKKIQEMYKRNFI